MTEGVDDERQAPDDQVVISRIAECAVVDRHAEAVPAVGVRGILDDLVLHIEPEKQRVRFVEVFHGHEVRIEDRGGPAVHGRLLLPASVLECIGIGIPDRVVTVLHLDARRESPRRIVQLPVKDNPRRRSRPLDDVVRGDNRNRPGAGCHIGTSEYPDMIAGRRVPPGTLRPGPVPGEFGGVDRPLVIAVIDRQAEHHHVPAGLRDVVSEFLQTETHLRRP